METVYYISIGLLTSVVVLGLANLFILIRSYYIDNKKLKPKYTIERHHAIGMYYPKYGNVYLYRTNSKQIGLSYPIFGGKRTKDEALEIIKEHKESFLIEIINVG